MKFGLIENQSWPPGALLAGLPYDCYSIANYSILPSPLVMKPEA